MSDGTEDLWPDFSPAAVVTPASILKTQATTLSRKSKGLVLGEVETWSREENIYHRLVLVVPALENYRYSLLQLHHQAGMYPVYVDDSPLAERPDEWADLGTGLKQVLKDERSFREWLRKALAASETKRILESLLAQATM